MAPARSEVAAAAHAARADVDVTTETDAEVAAAATDVDVAAPEEVDADVAPGQLDAEIFRPERVQELYEAALAKLDAMHEGWATALTDLREAPVPGSPEQVAA
jgi:hypothetical protein